MININNRLHNVYLQTAAGASAGFLEVLLMYPLDLVKTRLQIQCKQDKLFNGVVDCFVKTYKHEGFRYLYRGMLSPLVAETPKRAVKFVSFEQFKEIFTVDGMKGPTTRTYFMAGMGSGLVEALFSNPFEVIKVNCQACREIGKKSNSAWITTKKIIKENGFGKKGLYKGLVATMYRNAVYSTIYFGSYYSGIQKLQIDKTSGESNILKKLILGFTAGTAACCANIPFDVAKSRIQGPQPVPGQVKYKTTLGSMVTILKEEGPSALYVGLTPKILRLGPGGAVMFIVYEHVFNYLALNYFI